MIVKIQTSIHTTHAAQQVIVYNEDRSFFVEFDMDNGTRYHMMGKKKKFFEVEIADNKKFNIIKELSDQGW